MFNSNMFGVGSEDKSLNTFENLINASKKKKKTSLMSSQIPMLGNTQQTASFATKAPETSYPQPTTGGGGVTMKGGEPPSWYKPPNPQTDPNADVKVYTPKQEWLASGKAPDFYTWNHTYFVSSIGDSTTQEKYKRWLQAVWNPALAAVNPTATPAQDPNPPKDPNADVKVYTPKQEWLASGKAPDFYTWNHTYFVSSIGDSTTQEKYKRWLQAVWAPALAAFIPTATPEPEPEPEFDTSRQYEIKYFTAEDCQRLGLPETYIGLPMAIGYKNKDGTWVTVEDKMDLAKKLHDFSQLERPNLTNITESDAFNAIQELAKLLGNDDQLALDQNEGLNAYLQRIGMTPEQYRQYSQDWFDRLATGVQGQQGLSDEYLDSYNRQTALHLQKQNEEYGFMLNAMAASGRSVAAFQKMDTISRSLADYRHQRNLDLMNKNIAMQEIEYKALSDRYNSMIERGEISIAQYTQALHNNRLGALQAYAQEITTMAQQNMTDLQAYTAHADVMYKQIMTDLGVDESLLSQAQEYYEMYMAPYYVQQEKEAQQMQKDLIELQKNANVSAENQSNITTLLAAIGGGASIGGGVGAIPGAIVGGIVGLLGGLLSFIF